MSFNYTKVRDKATTLLTKFGQAAYLNRYESTTTYTQSFDVIKKQTKWVHTSTGDVLYTPPTGSLKQYLYQAVVSEYSINEIDGINILATDKKIILSYNSTMPEINEYLLIGTTKYKIVNISVVSPGSDVVLFKVQARI